MDESMRRIGESIHAERRNLDRNLAELEQHVLSMADWRTHYRNHTWAAVGIAAGTGLVMGMLTAVSPRAYRERGGRAWSALAQLDHHGRTVLAWAKRGMAFSTRCWASRRQQPFTSCPGTCPASRKSSVGLHRCGALAAIVPPRTTLSDPQDDVLQAQHALEMVRPGDEEVRSRTSRMIARTCGSVRAREVGRCRSTWRNV